MAKFSGDDLRVGRQMRCVFCKHQPWFAIGTRKKMLAKNCAVGHHPRCYPLDPKEPLWVERRRICKDFKLHKERVKPIKGKGGSR
jgi:hypothetical protein